MKLEKLKPGMTVYSVARQPYCLRRSTIAVFTVEIVDVNLSARTVVARWNSNAARTYSERTWKKWRMKEPETVEMFTGAMRLKTREEIRADKQKGAKP